MDTFDLSMGRSRFRRLLSAFRLVPLIDLGPPGYCLLSNIIPERNRPENVYWDRTLLNLANCFITAYTIKKLQHIIL